MKIGILTFHSAHNYGAVLQAYALKRKLEMYEQYVEIIDYRNITIENNYNKKIKKKCCLKNIKRPKILWKNLCFDLNIKYAQPYWEKQWDEFSAFIKANLIKKDCIQDANSIESYVKKFDILIVGSDQVWCSDLTGGLDPVYFLDFLYSGIRVSYAASMNRKKILDKEKQIIRYWLEKYDSISVREESLAKSIRELGYEVKTVVDPTLLLTAKDYLTIEKKRDEDNYIFAYYVTEDSKMSRLAHDLSEKKNMKLYELHYYHKKNFDDSYQFSNLGPGDFLTMIKNASFVITNSFHGTAFSIIYHVAFYSYGNNIRIYSLLKDLELLDRMGTSYEVKVEKIDWKLVDDKILSYRKSSEQFIKNVLSLKKNRTLFNEKYECCGCQACYNVCPISAINMIVDSEGFSYPQIDIKKCVTCGLCTEVCGFKNKQKEENII